MTGIPAALFSTDDLALSFDLAPVGLCVSRNRIIQRCNEAMADMFGYSPAALVGQSLASLYPSTAEFENIGQRGYLVMRETGRYRDDRIMRHRSERLFWCHVAGRSLDRNDPFACAVWMFEDISEQRPVIGNLTVREREIAQFLATGKASKQIARQMGISPRTVEAHRARLMKKLGVSSHTEMISRLVGIC
jgi:PAS domain S-box-containing protein